MIRQGGFSISRVRRAAQAVRPWRLFLWRCVDRAPPHGRFGLRRGVFLSALLARGRWPPGCQYRGRQALALISLLSAPVCGGVANRHYWPTIIPVASTAAAQHRSGRHPCQVSPIWHPSSGYTRRLFAASFRPPPPRVRRSNNSQRELFFIPRRRTHAYACARTRSCARRRD